jgi:hypothetical protein
VLSRTSDKSASRSPSRKQRPAYPKELIRYAPSFLPGYDAGGHPPASSLSDNGNHIYTAESLAKFLGLVDKNARPQEKFTAALDALALIEEGLLTEEQVLGVKSAAFLSELIVPKKDPTKEPTVGRKVTVLCCGITGEVPRLDRQKRRSA